MLSLAAAALLPGAGAAQQLSDFPGSDIPFDLPRGEAVSVLDRPHPELAPLGIPAGGLTLFPTLTTGIGHTSNVYGQATRAVADGYATAKPQLALVSRWPRDLLEITGTGDIKRFFTRSARSHTGYAVQADGRIELGADDTIAGLVRHERRFEEQYSGSFPQNAAGPVGVDQTDAVLRATFAFDRLRLIASAKIVDLGFANVSTLTGQVLDEKYRDRTEYRSAIRAAYAFDPDIALFAEAACNRSDYHVATLGQPLRSNTATRFLVGGNFDLDKLIRGTIGIGYEDHEYDQGFYVPITGIAWDAQLQWLPTELTTVNVKATRKIEDATNARSPGYFASIAQLRIDHELLRYVLLFAEATYEHDRFVALARRDRQYQLRGGASYSLGRRFKLLPSAWYIKRDSAGAPIGPVFREMRGTVELLAQW